VLLFDAYKDTIVEATLKALFTTSELWLLHQGLWVIIVLALSPDIICTVKTAKFTLKKALWQAVVE